MHRPTRSLGKMSAAEMFPSGLPSTRTSRQVVASFLKAAEGVAHRWIDTRKGVLLLQMAPYQPASGEIYIYDRQRDMWNLLEFEVPVTGFDVDLFEHVYREYKLLSYVEQPGLLQGLLDRRPATDGGAIVSPANASANGDHDEEMAALMASIGTGHFDEQIAA